MDLLRVDPVRSVCEGVGRCSIAVLRGFVTRSVRRDGEPGVYSRSKAQGVSPPRAFEAGHFVMCETYRFETEHAKTRLRATVSRACCDAAHSSRASVLWETQARIRLGIAPVNTALERSNHPRRTESTRRRFSPGRQLQAQPGKGPVRKPSCPSCHDFHYLSPELEDHP